MVWVSESPEFLSLHSHQSQQYDINIYNVWCKCLIPRQEEEFILLQSKQVNTDKIGRNIHTRDYMPGRRDRDDTISTLVQNLISNLYSATKEKTIAE